MYKIDCLLHEARHTYHFWFSCCSHNLTWMKILTNTNGNESKKVICEYNRLCNKMRGRRWWRWKKNDLAARVPKNWQNDKIYWIKGTPCCATDYHTVTHTSKNVCVLLKLCLNTNSVHLHESWSRRWRLSFFLSSIRLWLRINQVCTCI